MKKVSLCFAMVSFFWVCGVTTPALCCDLVCPEGAILEVEPNGGCFEANPVFDTIGCGTTIWGHGSYIGGVQDRDNYVFTLEENQVVRFRAQAEFDWYMGIQIPFSSDPCDNDGGTAYSTKGIPCEEDSIKTFLFGPGPGVYILFINHRGIGEVDEGDYWIEMTCEDPPPCKVDFSVSAPGSWTSTTTGAGNDCLLRPGEDHMYEIELPWDGRWTFSLCNSELDWNTYMYLGSECCRDDLAIGDQRCDGGYGNQVYIKDLDLTAGTYYLDIEPYYDWGDTGPYTLDITYEPPCILECPEGSIAEVEPNGGCNSDGDPEFSHIAEGQTVCATAWCDGSWRDTDWYEFTLESNQYVTLTGTAEFAYTMGFIIPDFDGYPCSDTRLKNIVIGERCDSLSTTYGLAAGTYYAFFAPLFTWTNIFTEADYQMTMTCEHLPSSDLAVTPTEISAVGSVGEVITEVLTVSNMGDADLLASVSVNILPPSLPDALAVIAAEGKVALGSGNQTVSAIRGMTSSNFIDRSQSDNEKVLFIDRLDQDLLAAAPAESGGDTIEDAIPITKMPFRGTGSTYGFTDDYDEACPYSSNSPDVVYSFVATIDTVLDLSLCRHTNFDSKLYVYENEAIPGTAVACDDNSCDGWLAAISLDLNAPLFVTAGNTYYVVVDGSGDSFGDYVLEVKYSDPIPGCPSEGSLWSARPTLPLGDWAFWNSDAETGYTVYENFAGVFGTIESLRWWGLDLEFDPDEGYRECDAFTETFEIAFYLMADNGMPGACVSVDTVTVIPTETGFKIDEQLDQKEYEATIDPPVRLAQGWVSIRAITVGDNCLFLWQNTFDTTDVNSITYDGVDYSLTGEDMSLCINGTSEEPWLSVDVAEFNLTPGMSAPLTVTLNAADMPDGVYNGSVVFYTNEVGISNHTVPVTFSVGSAGGCDCRPGEVNSDGIVNILDIGYLIEYVFESGPLPIPFESCGDANCDCAVNIVDIDHLIAYLFESGMMPCSCEEWITNCSLQADN